MNQQETKIGMITFLSNNYGTCLQAFAMKKALERMEGGGKIEFIYYERKIEDPHQNAIAKTLGVLSRYSVKELLRYKQYKQIIGKRNRRFSGFKHLIIERDGAFHSIGELSQYGETLGQNDTIICGSDMIWSAEFSQHLGIYMLTWTGKAKRVSYAPSIGNLDIPISLQQQYKDSLRNFSSISCREKSGALFLSNLLERDIPVVSDPTLLFDATQWLQWFSKSHVSTNTRPYILVYCFGGISEDMHKQLDGVSKERGMDVRYILSPSVMDTVGELKYGDGAYGPSEYVQLFSDAAFTVVNGYHGLLFSLIFEKPFVLLHRSKSEHWGTHENRMSEILEAVHLENRYVEPEAIITEEMLTLDYSKVSEIISERRCSSWNYLKEALQ